MRGNKTRWSATVSVVVLLTVLLVVFPACAQERNVDTLIDSYDSLVKQGMEATERLLKSTKIEKSEVEGIWDDLNERFISVYSRIGHIEFDSMLKVDRNASRVSRASEWDNSIKLFIHDLQNVGEVVAWQRKVNSDIFHIGWDIEYAPRKMREFTDVREQMRTVDRVAEELKGGKLSSAQIQRRLDDLRPYRPGLENMSDSIDRMVKGLSENLKLKPEMDKRISQILGNWTNIKARHPNVNSELTDMPPNWVALAKKHWENLEKAREDVEKAYGPLLNGTLFSDVPLLRGLPYKDLAKPVIELEIELKSQLVSAARKEKSVEELRKAIAEDEELTKKENERYRELHASVSAVKLRELMLEDARAAGGQTRIRDLQIIMARNPEGSEEYRKASEEMRLINEERHPEQIAVKKKLQEFYALEKKVEEEIRKLFEEHDRRRKSLGLPSGLHR